MKKKRIGIMIHGGIGTGHFAQGYPMLERLLNELSKEFELTVYSHAAPQPEYSGSNFVLRFPSRLVKFGTLRWLILCWLFLADHFHKRFDVLVGFWGWPAGWIATCLGKLVRTPSVVNVLGGDAAGIADINYGILHRPWLRKLVLWAYRNTSLLLAISHYQVNQLERYGLNRKVDVIPWGADSTCYTFLQKSRNEVIRFIHVGHLSPVKDQVTMVKTFARILAHRPAVLHILGVDCMGGTIQSLCSDLGIEKNVRFFDMVPYRDMPNHYAWADAMIHTSRSEGQCMALTEAAACGVLITGTRVGLLYDLEEACGITVEIGDYLGLSEKILDIIEKPELWQMKIKAARAWSHRHDLTWTISRLGGLLRSV